MALFSRGKRARAMIGIAIAAGGTVALGLVWLIVSLLIAWATAHFLSFAIVMGFLLLVGAGFGIYFGVDWATDVLQEEKDEEERALERKRIEDKLKEYSAKWGEGKVPPRSYNGTYYFDSEPEESAIG